MLTFISSFYSLFRDTEFTASTVTRGITTLPEEPVKTLDTNPQNLLVQIALTHDLHLEAYNYIPACSFGKFSQYLYSNISTYPRFCDNSIKQSNFGDISGTVSREMKVGKITLTKSSHQDLLPQLFCSLSYCVAH